jgi:tRNA-splicing ligase RtcB
VVVLIHSGSRGLGHQVCTDYVSVMNQPMARHLPMSRPTTEAHAPPVSNQEASLHV